MGARTTWVCPANGDKQHEGSARTKVALELMEVASLVELAPLLMPPLSPIPKPQVAEMASVASFWQQNTPLLSRTEKKKWSVIVGGRLREVPKRL